MPKQPDNDKKKKKEYIDTWELEADYSITLEDLVDSPPFNETNDESGDSITMGTRVPQWLARRITKIRETPGVPYEINSDILRDAIYLGLQILQLRYKLHDWEIEKKLASVVDATGMSTRIAVQVTELCKYLEKMHADDDNDHAVRRLDEFVCAIDTLTDDWHRRTIIKLLKRRGIVTELLTKCSRQAREIML